MKACPGLGTPATPEQPRVIGCPDAAFRQANGVGVAMTKRWSGRTMARTGLRMMPTFPSSPLRFRKAGFPRYGSKAGLSDRAFPDRASVKLAPSMPVAWSGLPPSFVLFRSSMDPPF